VAITTFVAWLQPVACSVLIVTYLRLPITRVLWLWIPRTPTRTTTEDRRTTNSVRGVCVCVCVCVLVLSIGAIHSGARVVACMVLRLLLLMFECATRVLYGPWLSVCSNCCPRINQPII
jgi:hypothetical protein